MSEPSARTIAERMWPGSPLTDGLLARVAESIEHVGEPCSFQASVCTTHSVGQIRFGWPTCTFVEAFYRTPPDRAPEPLREAVSRANVQELAEEAVEGGYRHVEIEPHLLLRLLDAARDSRPVGEGLAEALLTLHGAFSAVAPQFHSSACDVESCYVQRALQAGPAAVRPVERELDEERLARAICAARDPIIEAKADMFADDECRMWARQAIAEYRRLSTTQPASTEAGE